MQPVLYLLMCDRIDALRLHHRRVYALVETPVAADPLLSFYFILALLFYYLHIRDRGPSDNRGPYCPSSLQVHLFTTVMVSMDKDYVTFVHMFKCLCTNVLAPG